MLYKNILADKLEGLHVQGTSSTTPERTNLSLPDVLHSLIELQDFLTDLQHQVQQHIQQVVPRLKESQEKPGSSKYALRDIQQLSKKTL